MRHPVSETQAIWVLNKLLEGKEITPHHAIKGCGCLRLAAVIHNLKQAGWNIVNIWDASSSKKKHFARYVLRVNVKG